ncbi:MAG: preprotein translocase subunit SecE [Candidatus Saccharibacteria bacterium]
MATKAKKTTTKKVATAKTATTVTRITAADSKQTKPVVLATEPTAKTRTKSTSRVAAKSVFKPLISTAGYFKGAWYELRQVHWPDRKQTWGLTAAVIIFSAFFIVLIVLLDALFKFLFELILK